MANEEYVERLTKEAEAWNAWRKENPKVKPDLSNADFEDADLSGADLIEADLLGVNFIGADLSRANISRANLSGARLSRANLNNADLIGADLIGAKLNNADLSEANLIGANLSFADLRGTSLSGADLSEADLLGAKLSLANINNTNLSGARLSGAQLNNADLSGAKLNGANLNGAKLSDAKLTKSHLGGTVFANVNLSNTKGLEHVRHSHPSTLGVDTLYASKGKIPEVFLRGCGIPQEFIEHSRGLFGRAINFYSCFISYSHEDKSFAQRLHDHLQARGIRCWLDEHQMKVGDKILPGILDAIRMHDKVLLCCSGSSLKSEWVVKEIETALQREMREGRLLLFPLNLDGYLFDGYSGTFVDEIQGRHAANFTGWESDNAKFEEQFELVVKALRTDEAARQPAPEPKL